MLPKTDHPTENIDNDPPIDPRKAREEGRFLSFEDVQGRLVEAMLVAWRLPDREAGWHRIKAMWPDIRRHTWFGDYGDTDPDARPAPSPLTRMELADMDTAFAWLDVVKADDRKLIGLALRALARGESRVPWRRLLKPMGLSIGAHGLRKRYSRAMMKVVERANGGFPPQCVSRG